MRLNRLSRRAPACSGPDDNYPVKRCLEAVTLSLGGNDNGMAKDVGRPFIFFVLFIPFVSFASFVFMLAMPRARPLGNT